MKLRKAVIPAAGLGTRFLPATKVVPKELLPIIDRPALEYIVEELIASGIEEIILVLSHEKWSIYEHFSFGGLVEETLRSRGQLNRLEKTNRLLEKIRVTTTIQDRALGLGHAVLCAEKQVGDEPFAVVLPDDLVRAKKPCLKQLADVFRKEKKPVVAVEEVAWDQIHRYGAVGGKKSKETGAIHVDRIVEKPKRAEAPSRWAIIGRYVLVPEIFEVLHKVKPGSIGEIQLTDALAQLMKKPGLVAYPFEGMRIDAGQPPGLLEASLRYGLDDRTQAKWLKPLLRKLVKEL